MFMITRHRRATNFDIPPIVTILLLLCFHSVTYVQSFIAPTITSNIRNAAIGRSTKSAITSLRVETEALRFVANIQAKSDPIENVTVEQLGKFLSTTQCRDYFLSAGNTTKCIEVPITSELEQMWTDECELHYGPEMLRGMDDTLVISEAIVQFPGLKMVNEVYCGVKVRSNDNNLPQYDTILIAERKTVFGTAPIVWLFNLFTGHSAAKEGILCPPSAKAQSIITVVEMGGAPCFSFDCTAEIVVKFPKVAMKFVPASKEKMEQQGTASVKKAIERDILIALSGVNNVYLEWFKVQGE